jgi:hypothetical protein
MPLQRVAEARVEQSEGASIVETHAVRRIGDEQPRRRRRRPLEHVGGFKGDPSIEACRAGVAAALLERARSAIAREDDGHVGRGAHAVARALADALPCRPIEPRELLKAERARESRRAICGERCGLDRNRSAPAHRIEERRPARPAGQRDDAGREILAQRCRVRLAAPAALEQRLARGVEVECRFACRQVRVNAHIGVLLGDRGSPADVVTEAVADGVLHLERRVLEARERRPCCRYVDAKRALDLEAPRPLDAACKGVELVLATALPLRDLPEDAAREPRLEVRVQHELERSAKGHAALGGRHVDRGERGELRREGRFQAARARREEALGHRSSRRRVSTRATK